MCTTCMQCRGQKKALASLELDLQVAVSQGASWELNLGPLHESPVLLTMESSLQLHDISYSHIHVMTKSGQELLYIYIVIKPLTFLCGKNTSQTLCPSLSET